MIRTLTVLLALMAFASCSHISPVSQRQHTTGEFALSLQAIKLQIPAGTTPTFRLTFTNLSDHAFRILDAERRVDLQHTYYNLVITKDGQPVWVGRAISDPGPISDADWLEILPGATKTFVLTNFPEAFDQLPPGVYEAYVDFWRDPYQNHTTAYASDKARFTVTK
jgi:hypothetical protein